jgi:ATP-dependent Clp protease ATP-binding subunit ClpA
MEVGADGRSHMTVGAGEPYEQVERKVKTSVENYFKYTLGRPELFNRIGADNVVVFDFIRPPVDEAILQMQLDDVVKSYKTEKNIDITIERAVFDTLLAAHRAKSELGGRGIRNMVEARIRTPLDTHLFDEDAEENATVIVHGVCGDDVPTLDCTIVKHP